jgi:hypothetical protein
MSFTVMHQQWATSKEFTDCAQLRTGVMEAFLITAAVS